VRCWRPSLWLVLLAALVVAAGVAAFLIVDKSDAEKVEDTFDAFQEAYVDRDGAKACAQLDANAKKGLS
jgi:hypothetical protein